jgi:hypothetical protein
MCTLSQHWSCFQQALFQLPEEAFPAGLTPLHTQFMWLLDWVPVQRFVEPPRPGPGHPPHDRRPLLRAFLAKALGNFPTTEALIERLQADPTLRRLCGWETRGQVPERSTFSRAFAEFARGAVLDQIHVWLVQQHLAGVLVWHVSRDSTAIEARERSHKPPPPPPPPPKKRGGPKKSEPPRIKEPTRIQRQYAAPATATEALLAELPDWCDVGAKRNANGDLERWRGYKFHVDTGDEGIPLGCFTTSASMHDSQAAIPLARTTATRVNSLYDLMDAAYDAEEIWNTSYLLGHVPIIDLNPRRDGPAAKLPMEPDRARRYRERSGAERFNALLKDSHGGRTVRVRGRAKVHAHLMTGVVVIFAAVLQSWARA